MKRFPVRASVLAVQGVLVSMAFLSTVHADSDVTAAELTTQTSTIEVGAINVNPTNSEKRSGVVTNSNGSSTSYKFGEYNGLQKSDTNLIGNIDLRGGGAYDSGSTSRYRLIGTDLGLETRSLIGEYSEQGKFRFTFGYDEALRNRSDTYMTPYIGAGGNVFTLPSTWVNPTVPQTAGVVTSSPPTNTSTSMNFRGLDPTAGTAKGLVFGVVDPITDAKLSSTNAMRAADLAAFQNVNLYTKRTKTDAAIRYEIDTRLNFTAGVKHETKVGYKPLSVVTSQKTEFGATLPDPINQTTDQFNLGLNYKGDGYFLSADYYGSVFSNDVKSVTWNDVNSAASTATIATAPSNQFHQLGLTGGYNFTPATKLVVNASYARNTQDESFVTAGQNNQLPLGLPANSLGGLVVTTAFNAKLSSKINSDLGLTANYKYEKRDNQTAVNTYFFQDANETSSLLASTPKPNAFISGQGDNLNMYANRSYSKTINQLNLDADYKVAKGEVVKVGYDSQQIDRSCNGSWINCADAPKTNENTLRLDWRGKYGDDTVSARAGYAYSQRTVNYDENAFLALTPYANVMPTLGGGAGATMSAYQYMQANGLSGFGPATGYALLTGQGLIFNASNGVISNALYGSRNVISELIGMRRFNMADRNRDKLRAAVDWQANDKLTLTAAFDYNNDNYQNSVYGLRSSSGRTFNFEGAFAASDDFSTSLYYTNEDKRSVAAGDAFGSNNDGLNTGTTYNAQGVVNKLPTGATAIVGSPCYATIASKNQNGKMDPCLQFSNESRDKVDTIGLSFKKKGLMAGKFDFSGAVLFSHATTDITVTGGSYVANPALTTSATQTTAVAQYYILASALPTITTDTLELKLGGKYSIDKKQAIRASYSWSKMKVVDWAYDGMQFGTGTNYLPTNEQAPDYVVQTLGISYIYSF
jgi:MtrB/PioB family decaheme-associated outer membrane protein